MNIDLTKFPDSVDMVAVVPQQWLFNNGIPFHPSFKTDDNKTLMPCERIDDDNVCLPNSTVAHVPSLLGLYSRPKFNVLITNNTDKQITIDDTLSERGKRYGKFEDGSKIMQQLKDIAHKSPSWELMEPIQREAMDMILHKVGRVLNGDPFYDDSWRDIAGFSKLVVDWLNGESK